MDRVELFEKWPGSKFADPVRHDREPRDSCKTKSSQEWIQRGYGGAKFSELRGQGEAE